MRDVLILWSSKLVRQAPKLAYSGCEHAAGMHIVWRGLGVLLHGWPLFQWRTCSIVIPIVYLYILLY